MSSMDMSGKARNAIRALILLSLTVGFVQVVSGEHCGVMMAVAPGDDGHLLRQKTMSAFRATCRKEMKKETTLTVQKLVCEKHDFTINCGDDETIDVKWALYGFDADSNHRCFINRAGPCEGRDETTSLEKVKNDCQERHCTITLNNDWYGSEPCPNVGKYLNVTYVCMHGSS